MMSGLLLDGSDHSMLPERGYTSDCISTHAQAISIVKFEVDRYKQQGKPPPVESVRIHLWPCDSTSHPSQVGLHHFHDPRFPHTLFPSVDRVITDVFIRYVRGKRAKGHPPSRIALKLSDLVSSIKGRNLVSTYTLFPGQGRTCHSPTWLLPPSTRVGSTGKILRRWTKPCTGPSRART